MTRLAAGSILTAFAAVLIAVLTGCSMRPLPPYQAVEDETKAAMQRVVDLLPSGTRVDDLTVSAPYACGDKDGVFFTGHWGVYPPAGFDNVRFVDQLPSQMGSDFERRETGVVLGAGNTRLASTGEESVHLDVTAVDVDGVRAIDILGLSRCAQAPASTGP